MDAMGGQEIQFPALLPREPYEATGRWTEYGDNIFRLKDRKKADYLLGPTHEELFTLTVKGEYSSYKDYPVTLYQIQTKYRDEARPRAGILRGREFLMKDSYSFDLDDDGQATSYHKHRDAYIKIFDRLGLDYVIVSAMSGAMGGSASEEFLAVAETGEDTFVRSTDSDFAANVEAVRTPVPEAGPIEGKPAAQVHHTPDTPTIETLVDFLNKAGLGRTFTAADTLKNVLLKTRAPGEDKWELLAVGLPGDREVDMKRLEAGLEPREVALIEETDFANNPFLVKGYIGPKALQENGVRYLVDPRVVTGTAWVTGADEADHHVVDLVVGRDFTPEGTIEAAEVREGDPSPDGKGTLVAARGIEIGHIFQLGRKYTNAFALDALGADSKPIRITMGSYGVGVSRLVAVIAEQSHDDHGLIWPREVAPADVHVVIAGKGDEIRAGGEKLAADLDAAGLSVLLDDRTAMPGVKFADADLIGVPTIVVVGRGLVNGVIEVKDRRTGERTEVAVDDAVAHLVELVG
jgi:prolyl-tRNA synthetase